MTQDIITVERLSKTYGGAIQALRNVSMNVRRGGMAAITGRSGSGKSTLLNIITGIDRPSGGMVVIDGASPSSMSERELAVWRGKTVGVVFQFFQLLPTLTVLENVMLPMDFCDVWPRGERPARAMKLLERVGIADQAAKFPSALSGGQQQRAAIARALANDPPLLVADEPTGNLDSQNAQSIFDLFRELAGAGKSIVIVTHETEFTDVFDVVFEMQDGEVSCARLS
jgi:putative ABC transport system ATP-binding protein